MIIIIGILAALLAISVDTIIENINMFEFLGHYEHELAIIAFSLALLVYVTVVSMRFVRPRRRKTGFSQQNFNLLQKSQARHDLVQLGTDVKSAIVLQNKGLLDNA